MYLKPINSATPQYKEGRRDGTVNMYADVQEVLLESIKAIEGFSKCLADDGTKCSPNMGDFVAGFNAIEIIHEFLDRVDSEFKRGY